jgi:hypothetical protein
MKIPKKVDVGGVTFKVIFPYTFTERSDIFGRVDFAIQTIMITNTTATGQKCPLAHSWQIFWHEIIHCIDCQYCGNRIGDEVDKEDLIEAVSIGLVQVFRDNFNNLNK